MAVERKQQFQIHVRVFMGEKLLIKSNTLKAELINCLKISFNNIYSRRDLNVTTFLLWVFQFLKFCVQFSIDSSATCLWYSGNSGS